jgi:hypothetical protein
MRSVPSDALLPPCFRQWTTPGQPSFRPDTDKRVKEVSTQRRGDKTTKYKGTTSMPSDQCAVYYPEELSLFGAILDEVVQSLPPNLRTPYNRAALAANILACASTGERDADALRRAALLDAKVRAAA